jgi:polyisoprenoid-binding protein YceI
MLRAVFCLALALGAPPAQAAAWRLDPETQVVVDVPWRGSDVAVRFPDLRGEVTFDETAPETARARIEASAAGAETGVGVVNALIRSPGYLDAEAFPVIAFQLDRLRRLSKSTARVEGRLTLRGVTRPLALDAEVFRYGPDPADPGRFQAGFDLTGSIDRTEFGSTGGLPEVPARLDLRIRLVMSAAR